MTKDPIVTEIAVFFKRFILNQEDDISFGLILNGLPLERPYYDHAYRFIKTSGKISRGMEFYEYLTREDWEEIVLGVKKSITKRGYENVSIVTAWAIQNEDSPNREIIKGPGQMSFSRLAYELGYANEYDLSTLRYCEKYYPEIWPEYSVYYDDLWYMAKYYLYKDEPPTFTFPKEIPVRELNPDDPYNLYADYEEAYDF